VFPIVARDRVSEWQQTMSKTNSQLKIGNGDIRIRLDVSSLPQTRSASHMATETQNGALSAW